jgi:hypothetical protein
MPRRPLQKLLGHEHLNTTKIYARIYEETFYRQFKEAMFHQEAIEVDALHSPEEGKLNLVSVTLEGGAFSGENDQVARGIKMDIKKKVKVSDSDIVERAR